jgi:hypothetical protein
MNNTTANNDNNSSNDEANSQLDAETNSNIAFISEAYQASIKSVPSQNIDANILKMAQQQRKHQKSTISKPAKLRWWENQHFYGAIAAYWWFVSSTYYQQMHRTCRPTMRLSRTLLRKQSCVRLLQQQAN